MNDHTNRVPAGVPSGGQFAASAHAESEVLLGAFTPEQRETMIANALGDGPPLSADEQRLLGILTDEKVNGFVGNDTDLDIVLEELESNGDDSSFYGAEQIGERLWAHYEQQSVEDGVGDFSFRLNRTEDGVESYSVGAYLGHDMGMWLAENHDSKYLSVDRRMPEDTSGLRKAIEIAGVIDSDYQRILAKARKRGFLPGDDAAAEVTSAREALAAWDATPEGDDIDVDTMAGVRDGLASLLAQHRGRSSDAS